MKTISFAIWTGDSSRFCAPARRLNKVYWTCNNQSYSFVLGSILLNNCKPVRMHTEYHESMLWNNSFLSPDPHTEDRGEGILDTDEKVGIDEPEMNSDHSNMEPSTVPIHRYLHGHTPRYRITINLTISGMESFVRGDFHALNMKFHTRVTSSMAGSASLYDFILCLLLLWVYRQSFSAFTSTLSLA